MFDAIHVAMSTCQLWRNDERCCCGFPGFRPTPTQSPTQSLSNPFSPTLDIRIKNLACGHAGPQEAEEHVPMSNLLPGYSGLVQMCCIAGFTRRWVGGWVDRRFGGVGRAPRGTQQHRAALHHEPWRHDPMVRIIHWSSWRGTKCMARCGSRQMCRG